MGSRQTRGRQAMGRPAPKKRRNRKKRRIVLLISGILFVILMALIVVALFVWKKYSPTSEKADLNQYYGVESEDQLAVIIDNEVVPAAGMISEGKTYLKYDVVTEYLNDRFYWDANENMLLYTLPTDALSVEVGSDEYTLSKEKNDEGYVILKTEGSTAYIALEFIQKYTNIDYEVYSDPNRVMIVSDWGETKVATVKKDTQVRYRGGVKSPVLTEISKKDEVTVIEDEGNWKKIRTKDGFIGYVKKNTLKKVRSTEISRDFEEPEYTNISKDYTINMVWHNVTNTSANSGVLEKIAETKGLTTLAPTWYYVKDTGGNLESIASWDYVNYAHQSNIEVWATVRDFDGGIGSYDESYELLSHTSSRTNLINQLISSAVSVGIDGINVDFENINTDCGEHFIQFIRELSVRCRQNNLVLSVDNYVPMGFNEQYNRKEQGVVADYVVIMGYDEHYGGSQEAGSVSSYNYVKNGIEATLEDVPAEKIISGIPFYTRLWKETAGSTGDTTQDTSDTADEGANDDAADGDEATDSQSGTGLQVESEALSMVAAAQKIASVGAETTWDEETKQNYATWQSGDETYEIWMEDAQSIEEKLKLMKEYKLAGTAAWALGQEDTSIWDVILKYVN